MRGLAADQAKMLAGMGLGLLCLGLAAPACAAPAAAPAAQAAPPAVQPVENPETLCGKYTAEAERNLDIPEGLLTAISRLESGRRSPTTGHRVAWPWTINVEGQGHYFDSRDEAEAAVRKLLAEGVAKIDVGCMQVNLYHHPTAFATIREAFNPAANIAYGAKFLRGLYESQGSWNRAVAGYHSLTPGGPGNAYLSKVMAFWRAGGKPTHLLSEVWDPQPQPLDQAAKAYQRGDYQSALVTYRSVLKVEPDSRVALLGTALTLEREGHRDEAYQTYKRVLTVDPYNEVALAQLIGIVEQWAPDARIAAYRDIHAITQTVAELPARIAMAYAKIDDLDSAARHMGEAARLDPDEPRHMLNYASLSDRLGNSAVAVRAYEDFLRKYSREVALTVSVETVRSRLKYLKTETP